MKSKNYKGPERRTYLRLDADYTIGYIRLSDNLQPSGGIAEDARPKDISGAGVKILTSEQIPAGAFIEAHIKIPGTSKFITAICRVVRCEPDKKRLFSTALAFAWIAKKDREIIDEYVKKIKLNMLRAETKI